MKLLKDIILIKKKKILLILEQGSLVMNSHQDGETLINITLKDGRILQERHITKIDPISNLKLRWASIERHDPFTEEERRDTAAYNANWVPITQQHPIIISVNVDEAREQLNRDRRSHRMTLGRRTQNNNDDLIDQVLRTRNLRSLIRDYTGGPFEEQSGGGSSFNTIVDPRTQQRYSVSQHKKKTFKILC